MKISFKPIFLVFILTNCLNFYAQNLSGKELPLVEVIKTAEKQNLDLPMQHQILAYASDYNLLTTATLPHREKLNRTNAFYASLDHAIWFHRRFDIQDWLLYALDSPSASNARGFARGSFFDSKGGLVASVAQEGLIRQMK